MILKKFLEKCTVVVSMHIEFWDCKVPKSVHFGLSAIFWYILFLYFYKLLATE